MESLRCIFEIIVALGAIGGFIACFPIVRNWFKKADLETIIIDEDMRILSKFGTYMILKMAFIAKNQQTIISNIVAKVRHEEGGEKQLIWRYMKEQYSELSTGIGATVTNAKFQRALALIVYPTHFVERELWMVDNNFRLKENELKQKIREKLAN